MILTAEQQEKFLDLSCKLSPENLTCDGERSPAEVKRRHAAIIALWRKLEAEVGRKVTEDEIWANHRRGNLR
jgi:hypothetical protein